LRTGDRSFWECDRQLWLYVKAQGCHEIQGYYFSPPIPTLAMTALLKKGERFAESEGLRNFSFSIGADD